MTNIIFVFGCEGRKANTTLEVNAPLEASLYLAFQGASYCHLRARENIFCTGHCATPVHHYLLPR